MFKLELQKGLNNKYYIKKTAYNYMLIRIMEVYIDNKLVSRDQYHMEGPRAIRFNMPVEYPHRVFAAVTSIMQGNRLFT